MEETKVLLKKKVIAPKLRFREFGEDWKNKKLNEIILKLDSGVSVNSIDEPVTKENEYGILKTSCIAAGVFYPEQNKKIIAEDIHRAKLNPSKGSILISRMNTPQLVGHSGYIEKDYHNLFVPDRLWMTSINENNTYSKFLSIILASEKIMGMISNIATGTSGSMKNISKPNFLNLEIVIPSLPEQQKIAGFLSAVDDKMQLLNRKKQLLEQYKKGVMQQLFSGKLHFKDENRKAYPKWEEKRLDEVISKFIVPMRDKPKDLTGPIPWCRIEDFDGKYLSKSKSGQGVDITTIKEMNLKVYPIGTLLVSCSANLGFCAITKVELMTNQTFIGLAPDNKKIDVLYLYYVMKRSSAKLNILSSGTTISYLSREQFEKFKIPYPSLVEQKKISKFIANLDDKIDGINNQINQTQNFKKGLLQQMFV